MGNIKLLPLIRTVQCSNFSGFLLKGYQGLLEFRLKNKEFLIIDGGIEDKKYTNKYWNYKDMWGD